VATARFTLNVDTVDLDVKHLLIGGKPAGPIGAPGPPGPQGPPGGNVAGSIVQSPALAVCADRAQTGANCVDTRVYKFAGLGIAGWKTIATVIPSTVAGVQSMSKVKVEAVVNTRALGQGTLEAQAYVSIADGPPTVRRIGRDNIAGRPPRLQLVAGPNNSLLIQMASTDGVNPIVSGFAKIEYMLADAEGVPLTWRIE
jgi:hypothetical protein